MRTALSLSRIAPLKASAGLSCQQGQRARSRLPWGHRGAFKLQLTAFVHSQAGLVCSGLMVQPGMPAHCAVPATLVHRDEPLLVWMCSPPDVLTGEGRVLLCCSRCELRKVGMHGCYGWPMLQSSWSRSEWLMPDGAARAVSSQNVRAQQRWGSTGASTPPAPPAPQPPCSAPGPGSRCPPPRADPARCGRRAR